VAFRSAAAHRRAGTEARGDQSLRLESIERGVDGSRRDLAVQSRLDLFQDGATVRFLSEFRARTNQREQYSLFEGAEMFSQSVYIVDNWLSMSTCK